ncbi:MAG: peptidase M23, partial [Parcubacteria group bacterium Gr01-1014_106]
EKFLHWPFSPEENWRITNSYSGLEGHGNGIPFALDLQRAEGRAATQQSAARAAASGTVIHAGPLGGYGNAVVIRHDNGFATLYGHLDTVSVKSGAEVPALEKLGIAGNTGKSTGAHIHFEVRDIQGVKRWQDGTFVKPEPILGHSDFAGATPERPYPQAFGKPKVYSYTLNDLQPTPEALARDIAEQLKAFGTKDSAKDRIARRIDLDNSEPRPEPTPPRPDPRRSPGSGTQPGRDQNSQRSFKVSVPQGWLENPATVKDVSNILLHPPYSDRPDSTIIAVGETRLPSGSVDPADLVREIIAPYRSNDAVRGGYSIVGPTTEKLPTTSYTRTSVEVRRSDGKLDHAFVAISDGKKLCLLTFSPGYKGEKYRSTFKEVVNSFRFVGDTTGFSSPDPLPDVGYKSEYLGLQWDGKNDKEQCVWAARQFAEKHLGHTLPKLGDGGAEKLWRIETPGFRKVANDGTNLPPPGSLIVWGRTVNGGTGHVGVALGTVDSKTRKVCVIDSNWGLDQKGQIRHVTIAANIQGWLVRE